MRHGPSDSRGRQSRSALARADPAGGDRLPSPAHGFAWGSVRSGGVDHPALRPDTGATVALFTTRRGGVCPPPWDSLHVSWNAPGAHPDELPARWDDMVLANRDIAGRAVGADGRWSTVRQVHGASVVRATLSRTPREADALWTGDPSSTIAVSVADCVPVLLVSDGRVAVAHAGWRGLAAGVVESAASSIAAREAWIGPSIGPCCYEVGPDVLQKFDAPTVVDGSRVDLWAAAELAARRAGVETVHVAGLCTSCHAGLFFSHRRERGRTGRQALVARLP